MFALFRFVSFTRIFALISALVAGTLVSQSPEFTQQYSQRLGGAIDELQKVIDDFEVDARNNGLTLQEAFEQYSSSTEQFLRDRGESMGRVFDRLDRLTNQAVSLENTNSLLKPLQILRSPDQDIVQNAWEDFKPAIPVTLEGLLYAGVGFFAGWFGLELISAILKLIGRPFRSKRPDSGARA